jgi:hypothetical protein
LNASNERLLQAYREWHQIAEEFLLKQGILVGDKLIAPKKQFSDKEINLLVKLCHPDKHNSSKESEEITKKLLEMRK